MSHWILLANGAEHYLSGIETAHNEYDINAIAHHLAIINRFTGASCRPYSVAEHSLLCADIAEHLHAPAYVQLACLLHDAHEAITGDQSSPAKWAMGAAWDNFEHPHAHALRRWFKLQTTFASHRQQVKSIDLMALATERRDLMPWDAARHRPWPVLDTPGHQVPPADWLSLTTPKRAQMDWTEWRDAFLGRFHALREEMNATLLHRMSATLNEVQA